VRLTRNPVKTPNCKKLLRVTTRGFLAPNFERFASHIEIFCYDVAANTYVVLDICASEPFRH